MLWAIRQADTEATAWSKMDRTFSTFDGTIHPFEKTQQSTADTIQTDYTDIVRQYSEVCDKLHAKTLGKGEGDQTLIRAAKLGICGRLGQELASKCPNTKRSLDQSLRKSRACRSAPLPGPMVT